MQTFAKTMSAKKQARKLERAAASEFDNLIAKINKERGNVITPASKIPPANHIATGCFMMDYALLGGLPDGYATMFYGYESSGKTFMALKAVAGCQRKYPDGQVVWIDAEGLFDKDWAERLGCDLERLHVVRPETGNEAVDMIEELMEPLQVKMVVLDSVPGVVPKEIQDRSAEDKTMGVLAALMGVMCSKIYCAWSKERRRNHWVSFIPINQWRMKLGLVFGDPRTLPGGRQINHLPSTKVELKNKEIAGKDSFDSNMMVRNEHSFNVSKAKHGRSVREGEFHVSLSEEFNDNVGAFDFINHKPVVSFAKRMGDLVGGGGAGYKFESIDSPRFRTYDEAGIYLIENPDEMLRVQKHLISMQRVDKGLSAIPKDGYLLAHPKPPRAVKLAAKRVLRRE